MMLIDFVIDGLTISCRAHESLSLFFVVNGQCSFVVKGALHVSCSYNVYACSLLSQCFCFVILYDLVLSKTLNLFLARSSHSTVHLELLSTGCGPSHSVLIELLV